MNINLDRSHISLFMQELIQQGYAVEDLHSLRLSFEYTGEEMRANSDYYASHSREEWDARCVSAAQMRSADMFPVIEALSREFVCYQYDYDKDLATPYASDQWELFFWCNDFSTTTRGAISGRDYSYFTLSFNELMTTEQRRAICNRAIQFLTERFGSHPHLKVVVQYSVKRDDQKIADDAKAALPAMVGKKCVYSGMEGKIVQTEIGVFFMKKYAKKCGYPLSDLDILAISKAMPQ